MEDTVLTNHAGEEAEDVAVPAAENNTELNEADCANCSQLKAQATEFKTAWQRALADYQNLQKETTARRAEWATLSEQMILEEFIPVYDNFKKAFAAKNNIAWSKEQENWVSGIGYIQKQFSDILKSHQVEEIKTVGEKLDTRLHESVGEEERDGQESGTIIREVDGGYMVKGRVLKVAKVIIVK